MIFFSHSKNVLLSSISMLEMLDVKIPPLSTINLGLTIAVDNEALNNSINNTK